MKSKKQPTLTQRPERDDTTITLDRADKIVLDEIRPRGFTVKGFIGLLIQEKKQSLAKAG